MDSRWLLSTKGYSGSRSVPGKCRAAVAVQQIALLTGLRLSRNKTGRCGRRKRRALRAPAGQLHHSPASSHSRQEKSITGPSRSPLTCTPAFSHSRPLDCLGSEARCETAPWQAAQSQCSHPAEKKRLALSLGRGEPRLRPLARQSCKLERLPWFTRGRPGQIVLTPTGSPLLPCLGVRAEALFPDRYYLIEDGSSHFCLPGQYERWFHLFRNQRLSRRKPARCPRSRADGQPAKEISATCRTPPDRQRF